MKLLTIFAELNLYFAFVVVRPLLLIVLHLWYFIFSFSFLGLFKRLLIFIGFSCFILHFATIFSLASTDMS